MDRKPLDKSLVSKAQKRFTWCVSALIVRYHFVHQILSIMKHSPRQMGTMGVAINGSRVDLYYDPEFVESLSDAALVYVLYHECLHIALHHCTNRQVSGELWNIAHDLAINELIPINTGSCEPPRDKKGALMGTFVSEFKKMPLFSDIEERQSSDWYYNYLKQKGQDAKKKLDGKGGQMDDHGEWGENEVVGQKIRAKIKEIDRKNIWGDISQGMRITIQEAQTRHIDWESLLVFHAGNYIWKHRQATRKRPNRRMGYAYPGSKRLHVDKHLVVIDTSGSTESYLPVFLGVMNRIADVVPLDVAECDAAITKEPVPYDNRKSEYDFSGGGGTNFQPIIDIIEERGYLSASILTDGEASACTRPRNCQIAWVLPVGKSAPVEWGTMIHIEAK